VAGVIPKASRGSRTNRAEHKVRSTKSPARRHQPGDYGVDYLELAFAIRQPTFKSTKYATWNPRGYDTPDGPVFTSGWLEIHHEGHTIRLRTYRSPSGTWRCFLHFNPSRIVEPVGIGLCRLHDLHNVIEEVMGVVSQHVRPYGPSDYFSVRRIDIARNLRGITRPADYLLGLRAVYRPHATLTGLLGGAGPACGTLQSGSASGGKVKLYDKHLKDPHLAPPGTMRAEVEAHSGWCKKFGIHTVADLSPVIIGRLVKNRLDWFGLEREVMTFETACEKVIEMPGMSAPTKIGLLQYVLSVRRGVDPKVTASTIRKYNGLLKEHQIAPYLSGDVHRSVSRLDLRTGTEVRVAWGCGGTGPA